MSEQAQVQAPEEWQDISHEEYRTYVVPTLAGQIMNIRVDSPIALQRLPNGGQLVKDKTGEIHEINVGWVKLTYKVK